MGTVLGGPLEVLDHGVVVDAAQHLLFDQTKLLARGQLALARKASEAGQMVGVAACPPHPVAGIDLSAAPCTLGPKSAAGHRGRKGGGEAQTGYPFHLPVARWHPVSWPSLTHKFPFAWICPLPHPPADTSLL